VLFHSLQRDSRVVEQTHLQQETIMKLIRKIAGNKKGATAIEYGLLAALIAVAGVGAFTGVGSQIQKTFNNSSTKMSAG
jgi:pilus assembly protein Flp/PilA